MANNKNGLTSDFYCTKCGNKTLPIFRSAGKSKESGHLKKLYCTHCKKEHNAAEIRQYGKYKYDDFLIEFNNNNFDEKGNRIEPWRQFVSKIKLEEQNIGTQFNCIMRSASERKIYI